MSGTLCDNAVVQCPDKDCYWVHGLTMKQICNQNEIDLPHPNNAHYRKIMDDFEAEVLDNQDKKNVLQFLSTSRT